MFDKIADEVYIYAVAFIQHSSVGDQDYNVETTTWSFSLR